MAESVAVRDPVSDPVIRTFVGEIARVRTQIRRLVLFGSRARGDDRSDSDYDILVVVLRKAPELRSVLYDGVMRALLDHGRLVSLKIFSETEFDRLRELGTPFMERVQREGIHLG